MLTLNDFDYQLPPALIAHQPLINRDHSRLLYFNRQKQTWSHHFFYELPTILAQTKQKFVFVRNNSKVIPARLAGIKTTGGKMEIFLVKETNSLPHTQIWQCLTQPGLKPNQIVKFPQFKTEALCLSSQGFSRQLQFNCSPTQFNQLINTIGQTPIPPYIHTSLDETQLRQVYQTTYATQLGSVAAPTAGLHFTADLTQKLINQGFDFIDVTLHVGLGTFLSVKCNNIQEHHMHTEKFELSPDSASQLNTAIKMQKKIITVGTTSTRVLETIASSLTPPYDSITAQTRETDIYLYPPSRFNLTSGLITNFHLPKSTLLMLVAAFTNFPNAQSNFKTWSESNIGQAYEAAIAQKYRFFSFGDAMLII